MNFLYMIITVLVIVQIGLCGVIYLMYQSLKITDLRVDVLRAQLGLANYLSNDEILEQAEKITGKISLDF